jgi:cell division protein FtsW
VTGNVTGNMTGNVTGNVTATASSARSSAGPAASSRSALAEALDRPLTSYYLVLGSSAMLLVLGLVMVLSASSVVSYDETGSSFSVFEKQLMWFAIGLPFMVLASRLPVRFFRAMAYVGLVGVVGLLCLVVVAGVEVNGNRNWLRFGGLQIQPSEFAKLALIIWGADLLARKQRLLREWRHLLVPLLPVGILLVGLVLLGHDLGTSLVLMAIVGALLFFAGAPLRLFAVLGGAAGLVVATMSVAGGSRSARIQSWLNPAADPTGVGYQLEHSKYALASGNWWGLGLGASREKWNGLLPERHTDFIFAIIGEELGLVGTIAVLGLFAALAYGGIRVAARTRDPFVRLAAAGVTAWLMVQALVNVGAVLGVLPIAGIPLPLVSYGGSALLPSMLALGMLLAFARHEPGASAARKKRAAARRARAVSKTPPERAPAAKGR